MMKATATIRRRSFRLLLLVVALTGCATAPPSPKQAEMAPAAAAMLGRAQSAAANGNYAIAAREYLELSANTSDAAHYDYLLSAVEAFLHGNFIEQAKQTLHSVPQDALNEQQVSRRQAIEAAIAMTEHNPRAALDTLKNAVQADTPSALRITVHELRATAYNQLGNYLEAARERVALAPLLTDPEAKRRNEQALWQALMSLSSTALESFKMAPPPDVLSGWLELADIAKTSPAPGVDIDQRIAAWRGRYPNHPASAQLMASLLAQQPERLISRPSHIGLLLPMSGPFAKSAAAIRDGFLTAYYQRQKQDYQPVIQTYDTSNVPDIAQVYAQAVKDGAQLIVGPLEKDSIAALLQQRDTITVPTLVLNYTDHNDPAPAEFFQFGLAPEDEARMVAERAWLEDHQQALAVFPDSDWGKRIFNAFAEHWQQLGGKVAASQTYPPNTEDFSATLRRLLNINASIERAKALRATLHTAIKYEPSRRHDADFIFMAAFPNQARQIPPQLKFLYAGDLPVYATSHIFSGRPDAARDRDLDGVMFTDIPWLLTPQQFPLRTKIEQLWPETADQYARLYALGVDAYRLIPQLDSLRASPYQEFPGATGRLVIDNNNRIRRTLLWAQFVGGLPQLLPQTATPAP
jgi:outer membrane PBP1 activator LpoA protein